MLERPVLSLPLSVVSGLLFFTVSLLSWSLRDPQSRISMREEAGAAVH